jgi:hypothetical protein
MTVVVRWIKRTRGERSEHHKDSISEFRRSGNSKERGSNSQYANSRKDLGRQITKECGQLIMHEEGL